MQLVLQKVISEWDKNGDGCINFAEFCAAMRQSDDVGMSGIYTHRTRHRRTCTKRPFPVLTSDECCKHAASWTDDVICLPLRCLLCCVMLCLTICEQVLLQCTGDRCICKLALSRLRHSRASVQVLTMYLVLNLFRKRTLFGVVLKCLTDSLKQHHI